MITEYIFGFLIGILVIAVVFFLLYILGKSTYKANFIDNYPFRKYWTPSDYIMNGIIALLLIIFAVFVLMVLVGFTTALGLWLINSIQ